MNFDKISQGVKSIPKKFESLKLKSDAFDKFFKICKGSKSFTFVIMFLLGVITQISFLASNRTNNLNGLIAIVISAILMVLLMKILNIKNKILIFIAALITVMTPIYNDILITGENSIQNCIYILLPLLSLNLLFAQKYKLSGFLLAVIIFIAGCNIFSNCIEMFFVISAIKIIIDIFNKTEKSSEFLIHSLSMCLVLGIGIFL